MTNIFLKPVLNFIKGIRWRRWILIALVLSLGLLGIKSVKTQGISGICQQCHSMKPYFSSWEKSSHRKVDCYICHSAYKDPAMVAKAKSTPRRLIFTTNKVVIFFGKGIDYILKNSDTWILHLQNKVSISQMFLKVATGESTDSTNSLIWQNCFNCHRDLIASSERDSFGHFKHIQAGVSKCNQCHDNLAHGEQKKITWQQTCRQCHQNKPPRPVSHNTEDFGVTHGRDYLKNSACTLCHTQGVKEKACMDCHKTEVPHPKLYKAQHVTAIAKVGVRNCLNCHKYKSGDVPAASTACESCHRREMPHVKNVLQTHTALVKEMGVKACYYCHQSSPEQKDMAVSCVSCHQVDMPHQANFRATHPPVALAKGIEVTCYFCHSPRNPVNPGAPWASPEFCFNCHQQNPPHESGWINQHQTASITNTNNCNLCHPGMVENHCVDCHD